MEPVSTTEQPQEEIVANTIGCTHYKRKAKFVTPCCDKIYACRFCHDGIETHVLDRKEITEVVCAICQTRQPIRAECQQCATKFGKYTCLECNLFEDTDKGQFHCVECGICRVGGVDNYFHCKKCNICLSLRCQNGHKCVENVSRDNCPVCLEDIHTSRIASHVPHCGHLLHQPCYEGLLKNGHFVCPICQTSLEDMTTIWEYLDNEIANTPMPTEYLNKKEDILCRDCHKSSTVPYHVLALKCPKCGSYNTCGTKIPNGSYISSDDNSNENADGSTDRGTDTDENLLFTMEDIDGNTNQNGD